MIDESKFMSKLGMKLKILRNQKSLHSFKRKKVLLTKISEIIHRSLLAYNDISRILNLSYESYEKMKSIISEAKDYLIGTSFACSDEAAEARRKIWSAKC